MTTKAINKVVLKTAADKLGLNCVVFGNYLSATGRDVFDVTWEISSGNAVKEQDRFFAWHSDVSGKLLAQLEADGYFA